MQKTKARLADRRAFLKRAGAAAATIPAAALLLSAEAKAQSTLPYAPPGDFVPNCPPENPSCGNPT